MSRDIKANSRIAKNSILLYIRMIFLIIISLYTSRVVLDVLGIVDFGLYNVVGGIVTMFTFLSSAMGNSTQRYITFAMGKDDFANLHSIFSTTCLIHWGIAIIIFILSETVGLWFLMNKMVIPEERLIAAHWVFQFSVLACMVTIINIPYNALVIAHEKMGVFAFFSLFYAFAKLAIVYLIQFSNYDQLILYAGLLLVVQIMDNIFYRIYCKRNFKESVHVSFKERTQLKSMTIFAGWSLLPNLATVCYSQGINMLLNVFFGPAVNAARGISVQLQGVVKNFVANFQTAVSPQIIKAYANNDKYRLHNLVFKSSKLSYYLFLCIALPLFLEADYILTLWLKEVPNHTIMFIRLIILATLLDPLANPLSVANNATGKIRKFKFCEAGVCLLIIPIGFLAFRFGYPPESIFIIQILLSVIVQVVRVLLSRKDIDFTLKSYAKEVVLYVSLVTIISPIIPLLFLIYLPNNFMSFFIVVILSVLSVGLCAYYLGMSSVERNIIRNKITNIISKNHESFNN